MNQRKKINMKDTTSFQNIVSQLQTWNKERKIAKGDHRNPLNFTKTKFAPKKMSLSFKKNWLRHIFHFLQDLLCRLPPISGFLSNRFIIGLAQQIDWRGLYCRSDWENSRRRFSVNSWQDLSQTCFYNLHLHLRAFPQSKQSWNATTILLMLDCFVLLYPAQA